MYMVEILGTLGIEQSRARGESSVIVTRVHVVCRSGTVMTTYKQN